MTDISHRIGENLAWVRERIAKAAMRAGRSAEEIKLVAVTKYVGQAVISALVQAGCTDLGESRPQQLWQKSEDLADLPIRWHLIGHLQRNKVRRTLPLTSMIHSADSMRLIKAIDETAAELGRQASILLEVNTCGDPAKGGFQSHEVESLLPELATYGHVEIRGLMCMASLEGGMEAARRDFAALRKLRDRMRLHCTPEIALDELSMGMSGDFETAVEEGATIVRIGSALYEGTMQ
jgi:pyridoxal phosphate enzyme (YggS family)